MEQNKTGGGVSPRARSHDRLHAIGRLLRAVAASEGLDETLVAKIIASPALLAPHLVSAARRGTHLAQIGEATGGIPTGPLPTSLLPAEQGLVWAGYYQGPRTGRGARGGPAEHLQARVPEGIPALVERLAEATGETRGAVVAMALRELAERVLAGGEP